MRNLFPSLAGLALLLGLSIPAAAQRANNDGFHRRNGQMHVLRNGQLRPMTRDSRLPTGALVTKDGFVVAADGRRTELREGQACDLKGNVVAVKSAGAAGLALAPPAGRRPRPAPAAAQSSPAVDEMRAALADLLGRGRRRDEGRGGDDDKHDKHEEKAWERRKKEEEKWRESEKKRAEKNREREKKWEEKRREGKGWDD